MSDASPLSIAPSERAPSRWIPVAVFTAALGAGVVYSGASLLHDLQAAPLGSWLPYALLGLALLIALGFEFVNGFHDTANAVATVIYTHSLKPNTAVMWSGLWNFLGVLTSSGAVAFGIVSLLPVELILQVGSDAGFAMVFALLIAAIIWNLGTWWFGLPSSSSHTLIGSIIGVGLMNQWMAPTASGTSGVDWTQAAGIGRALLLSPLIGFGAAALLLLAMKVLVKRPELYEAPKGSAPPPLWIRGLLVLTCTGVSFAHGSNDGQKGMGLIMLILIGVVPTAYALNRAVEPSHIAAFTANSEKANAALAAHADGAPRFAGDPAKAVTAFVASRTLSPETVPALQALIAGTAKEVTGYGSMSAVPPSEVKNVRNDMYLASEALRIIEKTKQPAMSADETAALSAYKASLDEGTKFIPTWVKVAVAIALGLGTMVGWKRIVVTVGEKIGKTHLTYAQGASAELVAMATIGAADVYGLPVSTTHVLSSGVAGTMAANRSGLQLSTIRNLAMAWILTLPVSIALAGALFWILRHVF
ncbi:PiT family inorganic phosphate transporter [Methylopila capsulata]|uniref:Phosphate transporter n=1 Tax=Methylopila capsulata TaxID=61654 RepID=A0A9W6IVE5_9HYPH|nr:inorganic phosphate transporter [Methylopila capsulata]MBM7853542.1 PiT family inorganic phosphate transporter [Methylopila capsulata]GLK57243.1 phosphate transporter [Methylopila capsulata]